MKKYLNIFIQNNTDINTKNNEKIIVIKRNF
jgi:hypothetical protein